MSPGYLLGQLTDFIPDREYGDTPELPNTSKTYWADFNAPPADHVAIMTRSTMRGVWRQPILMGECFGNRLDEEAREVSGIAPVQILQLVSIAFPNQFPASPVAE